MKIPVLHEAMEHIRQFREYHNQSHWVRTDRRSVPVRADNGEHPPCGTTLCMAGWIAFLNAPSGSVLSEPLGIVELPEGRHQRIMVFAQDTAELTDAELLCLFHTASNYDELEYAFSEIIAGTDAETVGAAIMYNRSHTESVYAADV